MSDFPTPHSRGRQNTALVSLARWVFFRLLGWKAVVSVPHRDKCILCVAPHTSNWDFILGELFYTAIGRKASFLMKKEWFFFPLGIVLRAIGGIAIAREKKSSMTTIIAKTALAKNYFNLAVTPEGTRSRVTSWKRGFYYIAQKAELPIQLFAIDARNKTVYCTEEIIPTGNETEDLRRIFSYYAQFKDKAFYPEKFAVEEI